MAGMPQGLIIGTTIRQHASYSAMFCLLHSNIQYVKNSMKSISAIHPAITEKHKIYS